jgi:hypothetical protein
VSDEPYPGGELGAERALELLEARSAEEMELLLASWSPEEAARAREYLELFGLLSQAEVPEFPRLALRQSLLARATSAPAEGSAGHPERLRPVQERLAHRRERPPTASLTPTLRSHRGLRLLAAGLALCALGLGALASLLAWQLQEERAARRGEAAAYEATLASAQLEMLEAAEGARIRQLEERLAMLTTAGNRLCALRPPEGSTGMPRARGLLLMGDNGRGWHLEASGLEHLEDGRCYQLWFVPDEPGAEPVSGGTFLACDRGSAQMGAPRMSTLPRAVFVTLEAEGGAETPSGPVVLHGDRAAQVL